MYNQGNIRVLIVEDDYLVGEVVKGMLEEAVAIPSSERR